MPWTCWQITEVHAHEQFRKKPTAEELTKWLVGRLGIRWKAGTPETMELVSLMLGGWNQFDRLTEPQKKIALSDQ